MPGPRDFAETYVTAETLDRELAGWLADLAPYRWRSAPPISRDSAALLVVDVTRPFVDEGRPLASPNARAIVPRINDLVAAFRAASRPVIWIVQGHFSVAHDRGEHLSNWWLMPVLEGTTDVEPAAGLSIAPGEKVILKRRYSGFHATDLELTLRCLGVRQVAICGVLTHVCPFMTAMDAFERDFCVFYPPDATASLNRSLHVEALRVIAGWAGYVTPAREIIAALGG
ncbi:MAG: cysteine hydrolase [Phycisphaerae bacterium]|nr:cysteine hydrolase [Phycisphaerae bacterium]